MIEVSFEVWFEFGKWKCEDYIYLDSLEILVQFLSFEYEYIQYNALLMVISFIIFQVSKTFYGTEESKN